MSAFKKTNLEILECLKSQNFLKEAKKYAAIGIAVSSLFIPFVIGVSLVLSIQNIFLALLGLGLTGLISFGAFSYTLRLLRNMNWWM